MNVKPLSDRVVIQPIEAEEVSAGGIIIPENAKEKPLQGKVVAVGNGKTVDGIKVEMELKVGDIVLYGKYAGTETTIDNIKYLIINESDILAKLEN